MRKIVPIALVCIGLAVMSANAGAIGSPAGSSTQQVSSAVQKIPCKFMRVRSCSRPAMLSTLRGFYNMPNGHSLRLASKPTIQTGTICYPPNIYRFTLYDYRMVADAKMFCPGYADDAGLYGMLYEKWVSDNAWHLMKTGDICSVVGQQDFTITCGVKSEGCNSTATRAWQAAFQGFFKPEGSSRVYVYSATNAIPWPCKV